MAGRCAGLSVPAMTQPPSVIAGLVPAGSSSWRTQDDATACRFSTFTCFQVIQRTSRCDTTLRTSPKALLRLVRQRWAGWFAEAWRLPQPVALAPGHPTWQGRPLKRSSGAGPAADLDSQPTALQRFSLNPCGPDGRGTRHQADARLGWRQPTRNRVNGRFSQPWLRPRSGDGFGSERRGASSLLSGERVLGTSTSRYPPDH